jgi:hypothetical protein
MVSDMDLQEDYHGVSTKLAPECVENADESSGEDSPSEGDTPCEPQQPPPPANPPALVSVPAAKKRKRAPKRLVPTNDPDVQVQVNTRTKGRPKKTKTVTIYKEDLHQEEEQPKVVIECKSRAKGRPKTTKPDVEVKPSLRQIKKDEKAADIAKIEVLTGAPVLTTKKGEVDRRSVVKRTPAQLAATKRMLEANIVRRHNAQKAVSKSIVEETVRELAARKTQITQPKPEDVFLAQIPAAKQSLSSIFC